MGDQERQLKLTTKKIAEEEENLQALTKTYLEAKTEFDKKQNGVSYLFLETNLALFLGRVQKQQCNAHLKTCN